MQSISAAPTGSYYVGTTTIHLVDYSRYELHLKEESPKHRELLVRVFYPTDTITDTIAPYVSSTLSVFIKSKQDIKKGWFYGSGYIGADTASHSYLNAPVSRKQNAFPAIIFSPGFGVPTHSYTSLLEDLASHGFVVFAINHTHTADPIEFPDGRTFELAPFDPSIDEVELRYHDMHFVLNELEGINEKNSFAQFRDKIDIQHIGAMGHSIGAAAALELGKRDARIKAVIALDGLMKTAFFNPDDPVESYTKPLMIMYNAEQGSFSKDDATTPAFDLKKVLETMQKQVAKVRESAVDDAIEVQWKAHHMSFSDYFLLSQLAIDQEREMSILKDIKTLIAWFFERYLKQEEQQMPDSLPLNSAAYRIIFTQKDGLTNKR